MDAVKTDTFIKGLADKSADERASRIAYNETAGDDDVHERKLQRTMVESAERLSTLLGDYLCTDVMQKTGDNAIQLDYSDTSVIVMRLHVSDRFNESYTSSLARLSSQFIANSMLELWWLPINPNTSQSYANLKATVLNDIMRCFNKTAPSAPRFPYTEKLDIENDAVTVSVPRNTRKPFGIVAENKYMIDNDVIDDVEYCYVRNNAFSISKRDGSFVVMAHNIGSGTVTVWSRHNEADTKKTFKVEIKYEEE